MKRKIKLSEEKFRKLFKNDLNEISYGTVYRASDRSDDMFWRLETEFSNFYCQLEEIMFDLKYDSREGEQTENPYLIKIKEYADKIEEILLRKSKQAKNFDNELSKFDYKKFHDDICDKEDFVDYDELELRDLQNKYPNEKR